VPHPKHRGGTKRKEEGYADRNPEVHLGRSSLGLHERGGVIFVESHGFSGFRGYAKKATHS